MIKKDLLHLNTWWYRLFKVLFVFLFVSSILSVGLITYIVHRPYIQSDYSIQCYYGRKNSFIAWKQKGIAIPSSSIAADGTVGHLPDGIKQALQDACGITDDDISTVLNSMWSDVSSGKMIKENPLWAAYPVSYRVGSNSKAVGATLIAILILVIIFEVIRRAFFYIVTGSFFPKGRMYSVKSFMQKNKK
jgi:hypothetical protein